MIAPPLNLDVPGLFITGVDTEVGKTVISCAMALALRQAGLRVGASKPIASGCRHEREGLVSEDAEALAYFSAARCPLDVVNPVRYQAPVAPAVAAEMTGELVDDGAIAEALERIAADSDVMLVEGVGGLLTPLDADRTILELACWLGYPVVVVTHNRLGTLNQTAMTCRLIQDAGLRLAGVVINGYNPETTDVAEMNNPRWLAKQNRTRVLATVPHAPDLDLSKAVCPASVVEAVAMADWAAMCRKPVRPSGG